MKLLVNSNCFMLEKKLRSLGFSYESFSEENIPEFMIKYWNKNLSATVDQNALVDFANKITERMLTSLSVGCRKLLKSAVIATLLAEIYEALDSGPNTSVFEVSSCFELFERFVRVRCSKNEDKNVLKMLQSLAIRQIFDSATVKNLWPNILSVEEGILNVGIVHNWHGEYFFKYSLFPELFVVGFIIENIGKKSVIDFLFKQIFTDAKYSVLCLLIDDSFARESSTIDICRNFELCIYQNWEPRLNDFTVEWQSLNNLLLFVVERKYFEIFHILFSILQKRQQILLKLLLHKNKHGNSALYLAIAHLSEPLIKDVITFVIDVLSANKIETLQTSKFMQLTLRKAFELFKHLGFPQLVHSNKNLLSELDANGNSLLHFAVRDSNPVALLRVLDFMKSELSETDFKHLLCLRSHSRAHLLHFAFEFNAIKSIECTVNYLRSCNAIVLREMLLDVDSDEENVLFKAVKNTDINTISSLMSVLNLELNEDDVQEILTANNNSGFNVLQVALLSSERALVKNLISILKSKLPRISFQKMLLHTNMDGENLVHTAAQHSEIATITMLEDVIRLELGEEALNDLLHQETGHNTNVLYLVLKKCPNPFLIELDCLFNHFRNLIDPTLLHDFLSAEDQDRHNLFHIAVKNGNAHFLRILYDYIGHELNDLEASKMMLSNSKTGLTVFHIAVANTDENFLKFFIDFMIMEVMGEGFFPVMLKKISAQGNNVFHEVVKQHSVSLFQFLVATLSQHCDAVENMIAAKNYEDKTIIQIAIESAKFDFEKVINYLQHLFEILEELLGSNGFKTLLSSRDNNGHFLIHIAIKTGNQLLIGFVAEYLGAKLDSHFVEKMMMSSDQRNSNLILLTFEYGNPSLIRFIFEYLQAAPNFKTIAYDMLCSRLWDNQTAMHLAVKHKDSSQFECLLNFWSKQGFNQKTIQIFLQQLDNNHNNIFHLSAEEGDLLSVMKTVVQLDQNVFYNMLLAKNKDGTNPLHGVIINQERLLVTRVIKYLKLNLSAELFTKMLLSKTSDNENILHLAAQHTNTLTLKLLLENFRIGLTAESFLELVLAKNMKQQSLLHIAVKNGDRSMVLYLLMIFENLLDGEQYQELLKATTRQGSTLFIFAVQANNFTLINYLVEHLQCKVGIETVRKMLLIKPHLLMDIAAAYCDLVTIKSFIELLKAKFDGVEDFFGKELLNTAIRCGNKSVIRFFLDYFKSTGSSSERLRNISFDVFDECSASTVDFVLKTAKEELSEQEFRTLLCQKTIDKLSLIYVAVQNDCKLQVKKVLQLLSQYLEKKIVREMLMATDFANTMNILHYVLLGDISFSQFLRDTLREELSPAEIKKMLCQSGADGSNVLLNIVRGGSKQEISRIFDILNWELDKTDIADMILAETIRKNNMMHVAMIGCNTFTIDWLLILLETYISCEEINSMMLKKTKRGSYLFHHAVKANECFIVPHVYQVLEKRFDSKTADRLLLANNKIFQNVLYITVLNGTTTTLLLFLKYLRETRIKPYAKYRELITKMLFSVDVNRENLIMCAARNPDNQMLTYITKYLLEILPTTTVQKMIVATDKNGQTMLHIAVKEHSHFESIFNYLQNYLTDLDFVEAKTSKGLNIIEIVVRKRDDVVLENLLENLTTTLQQASVVERMISVVFEHFPTMVKAKRNILMNYVYKLRNAGAPI